MMLIGVDYHPCFQTIAFFVEETGECGEQELTTPKYVKSVRVRCNAKHFENPKARMAWPV